MRRKQVEIYIPIISNCFFFPILLYLQVHCEPRKDSPREEVEEALRAYGGCCKKGQEH